MATEVFSFDYDAGANIYIRIYGRTGDKLHKVFDFNDSTFKAAGTTATQLLTCDEQAGEDGTGKSSYTAAVDLAALNSTLKYEGFVIRAFDNASPAVSDVAVSGPLSFHVQAGEEGRRHIEPELEGAFTTTSGVEVRISAYLKVDGQRYTLEEGVASCTLTVREHGEGVNLYQVTETADALGRFELSQEFPDYDADRLYNHSVAINVDGLTFTKDFDIPNYA